VLSHRDNQFNVKTICKAMGDGTPLPAAQLDVQDLSLTRLSNTRFKVSNGSEPQSATYRWCGVNDGIPNRSNKGPRG